MHSFNPSQDSKVLGQAFQLNNAVHALSTRLELSAPPTESKYNPISISSSTISPSILHCQSVVNGETNMSTFLSFTPNPLFLADSCLYESGSSEFQSNSVLPYSVGGSIKKHLARTNSGLGLLVKDDMEVLKAASITRIAQDSPSLVSSEGMPHSFADFSPALSALPDPFDEFGHIRYSFSHLSPRSINLGWRSSKFSAMQSPGFSSFTFGTPGKDELSRAANPSNILESPFCGNGAGLLADINMFDKEDSEKSVCVRPQDTVGYEAIKVTEEPESPQVLIKTEDTMDEVNLQDIKPESVAQTYLETPETNWPQIPVEHLPFLVERYLSHFTSNQPSTNAFSDAQGGFSTVQSGEHSLYPFTPITTEILETVEEPKRKKYKKRLTDRTNVPKPVIRNGGSIMDMLDLVLPRDVNIENAYAGISAETIAQKTQYFMMMHPGERLPEELLFTFAGRLSASGEQTTGYRCYLAGCTKVTKRKDHMGDHIRTHLGEKPFQCSVCGMGFIRNNDCQRHENNHRPDKKFVCSCKAAFSRRDLFVRHQRTVCMVPDPVPETQSLPRYFNRVPINVRKGTPDGDDANDLDYVPTRDDSTWASINV